MKNAWLGPVVTSTVLILVGMLVYRFRARIKKVYHENEDMFTDFGHRLTVIFITMQV